ncbi:MAG TPA: GDSL-type esterase/lipase family protein [Bacteroidales bacterium]|nr:GDSL-type esterase/lipase family protein [Bacteroidales bacterium]
MIKRFLTISNIILCFVALHAQNRDSVLIYPFIKYDADTLFYNAKNTNLTDFFSIYNQAIQNGDRQVNIMHIGGSHVQGGTLPHTIRQNILYSSPERTGSRGMIFPYSAAPRSNNPSDYQVRSIGSFQIVRNVFAEHMVPLGVTGAAVITTDTAAEIRIILKDSTLQFKTDHIVLLAYSDSNQITPTIWIDSVEYLPVSYDTIKKRYLFETKLFTDSFTLKINNLNGERFIINGIFLGNKTNGITFHSIGVNGASVPSYLACQNFEQDLDLIHPDLVIFGIGINDASGPNFKRDEFKQNYLLLVEKIKKANPNCSFIFVTNNDSAKKVRYVVKKKRRWKWVSNPNALDVQQVMYELAEITNGAVFDQYEIMGGSKSISKWVNNGLAQKDRVHFTKAGYTLMGELFFKAFVDAQIKLTQNNKTINQ